MASQLSTAARGSCITQSRAERLLGFPLQYASAVSSPNIGSSLKPQPGSKTHPSIINRSHQSCLVWSPQSQEILKRNEANFLCSSWEIKGVWSLCSQPAGSVVEVPVPWSYSNTRWGLELGLGNQFRATQIWNNCLHTNPDREPW